MTNQLQNVARDPDVISAWASALLAAVAMSYVANAPSPGALHVLLAAVGLAGTLGAFLFIARAKIDADWKSVVGISAGVISVLFFELLSKLY